MSRVLRFLVGLEILASLVLVALVLWPFSGFCSGRVLSLDCESRAIIGVNIVAPLAILLFVCAVWSLKVKSFAPQLILMSGIVVACIYWVTLSVMYD